MQKKSSCPICGNEKLKKYNRWKTPSEHRTFVKCAACSHVFAAEFDEAKLNEFYNSCYYPSPDDPKIQQWIDTNRPIWDDLADEIISFRKDITSLLDFGAGSGGFIESFKAKNCNLAEIHAIENAPAAKENLIRRFPDGKIHTALDECSRKNFDCITALQCFEHLDDPLETCFMLHDKTADNGILIITVPNRFSLRTFLLGRKDIFNPGNPTHLQFFSASSMRKLLTKANFKNIRRMSRFPRCGSFAKRITTFICRKLAISTELRFICRK